MFTKKRRLPNQKKKSRWYFLALPILIFIGGVGILVNMLTNHPHFISALPTKNSPVLATVTTEDVLQKEFEKAGFHIDSVTVASDSGYLIHLHTGETIVANEKTPISQISSLQALLTNLTMEGKRIERLDIRFDKPVVLFKK
jgi:cell division septal protein FtsQ